MRVCVQARCVVGFRPLWAEDDGAGGRGAAAGGLLHAAGSDRAGWRVGAARGAGGSIVLTATHWDGLNDVECSL